MYDKTHYEGRCLFSLIKRRHRVKLKRNLYPPPLIIGVTESMKLIHAIRNGIDVAMETDPSAVVFGEDVASGGVFRATADLRDKYGE